MSKKLRTRPKNPPPVPAPPRRMAVHLGPLPPPEQLAQYDRCVQNGAERLFQLMERQSAHRIELENALIRHDMSMARWGQWFGFILGLVGIGGGIVAMVKGHHWSGAIISGSALASIVVAFLKSSSHIPDDGEETHEKAPSGD